MVDKRGSAAKRNERKRGGRTDGPVPSWKEGVFEMFRGGASVEAVMETTTRTEGTVRKYLGEFIARERPASVSAWVADDLYERIAGAVDAVGMLRMRPIYEAMDGEVDWTPIGVVVAHLKALEEVQGAASELSAGDG